MKIKRCDIGHTFHGKERVIKMKKILLWNFLILFLYFPIVASALVTNSAIDDHLKIYILYQENNQELQKEQEWLKEYLEDKDKIDIVYLNKNSNINQDLNDKISKILKIKTNEVPITIIGSDYVVGFDKNIQIELTQMIDAYQNSNEYCDLIVTINSQKDENECIKKNKKVYDPFHQFPTYQKVIFLVIALLLVISLKFILIKNK